MRSFLGLLLFLTILLGGGWYLHRQFGPCQQPVPLSIGSVDPRFKLPKGEFLSAVRDAAALWDRGAGKTLFTYTSTGGIPVSAVYDGRQEARDKLQTLGVRLDQGKRAYDALKASYNTARASYDRALAAYTAAKSAFQQRKAAFEKAVAAARGGAAAEEVDRLRREQDALNAIVDSLNAQRDTVQSLADEVNGVIALLNRVAAQAHLSLETFREVGSALGDEYEAGFFVRDAAGTRVTVYAFEGRNELTGILAHELGHVLGLGHAAGSGALMFRLNQTTDGPPALSQEDVAMLRERCTAFTPSTVLDTLRSVLMRVVSSVVR